MSTLQEPRPAAGRYMRVGIWLIVVAGIIFVGAFFAAGLLADKPSAPALVGTAVIVSVMLALGAGALMIYAFRLQRRPERLASGEQMTAALRADGAGEAWDKARRTLDDYIDRNLTRGAMIFYLSIAVMIVGFVVILVGVLDSGLDLGSRIAASGVGLLTQFIGATFLVVYQSTVRQADVYARMLDRVNAVGVALAILQTLDERDARLKSRTVARLAILYLAGADSQPEMDGSAAGSPTDDTSATVPNRRQRSDSIDAGSEGESE